MRWLAAVAATTAVLSLAPAARADAPQPRLVLHPARAAAGATVRLTGDNLPASSVFTVQVCGDSAQRGSVDCAVTSATTTVSSPTGKLITQVRVVRPPVACPCVVQLLSPGQPTTYEVPLKIIGMAQAPLATPVAVEGGLPLQVLSAKLSSGSWTSWFGLSTKRTLVVSVVNTNAVDVESPPLQLTLDSTFGGRRTVPSPALESVPAHGSRTFRIPISLGATSVGTARVTGELGYAGETVTFDAGTRSLPWALFGLALLLAHLLVLGIRDRVRRRLHTPEPDPEPETEPEFTAA